MLLVRLVRMTALCEGGRGDGWARPPAANLASNQRRVSPSPGSAHLSVYSANLSSAPFILQLFTSPEKHPVNVSVRPPSSRS